MRLFAGILMTLTLVGCAAHPAAVSTVQQTPHLYAPATAAALAFDPPALAGVPQLDLSRDNRDVAAFAGYQDSTTTNFYLRQDDRQVITNGDSRFQRQAVTETYGISYR